jgi:hypothetical protein
MPVVFDPLAFLSAHVRARMEADTYPVDRPPRAFSRVLCMYPSLCPCRNHRHGMTDMEMPTSERRTHREGECIGSGTHGETGEQAEQPMTNACRVNGRGFVGGLFACPFHVARLYVPRWGGRPFLPRARPLPSSYARTTVPACITT